MVRNHKAIDISDAKACKEQRHDVYRLHRIELDAIKDPEARHRRLVELNVKEQCINLFKTGVIQRRRVET